MGGKRPILIFIVIICIEDGFCFNYDYSSACTRPYQARSGRSGENPSAAAPCDLSKETYCNRPGSTYPWHAVRRFVHENQGLMRRMYGEQRHIAVLKAEIENNDLDSERDARHARSNTVPHFRPVQSTTAKQPSKVKKEHEDAKIVAYKTSFFEDEINSRQEMSKNNLETNKIEPEIISLEAAIQQTLKTNSVYPNYGISHKNASFYPTTLDVSPVETETTTSEYVTSETTLTNDDDESTDEGWKPMVTLPPEESSTADRAPPSSSSAITAATTNMEGQLYQDVVQEEIKPVVKLRGVNACPVKEEVVAPFWANNTRGEVLALLNLYPFEQYVHWEKCTHEHKQMFCRDGCRCEQQYRLHRLLAYDPNNECRGIFSDWFKFPSCCVCKCYDMPLEFRVTSRSPRTIEPDIDEAVRKEMYKQAASDWYTINYDD